MAEQRSLPKLPPFPYRYYFKLDEVPDSELKDAEFRLYKTKSHHDYEHYFISVFRMDSPKTADEK